jgi:serine/threonine protein kinase
MTVFGEARERLSPAERAAYLDDACGPDAALRARVEALLRADQDAGRFLRGDTSTPSPDSHEATLLIEESGTTIGPYKLLQQIGEGGMGVVYMAEQEKPVRRRVALKIIKPGMDSRQVIARFEAERQALALMDHHNIARVFDAGTTESARPYFVMELVHGVPITKYCDDNHLTPRERLELFVPVCQAVQHAHQKGIIHRDLKPSNVLVALYDGKPVPKVIDFGVAKATGQQLSEQSVHTGFGAVVGTLEYMSPEQAGFNQFDVDTRSDIYSLGVLLYELLTGSPPFSRTAIEEVGVLELLRMIREQEPPKPSTKLSTVEGLPALAANRGIEPKRLTALVRGELDWIVMKCLEKDRTRRYETANDLARDLLRYLADEPVLAGPPHTSYRLRKFLRRNRGSVAAAALVLLTLLAGTVGTSWGLVQARQQRQQAVEQKDRAEQEAAIAQAVSALLQMDPWDPENNGNRLLMGGGDAERNRTINLGELLDRAAKAIEGKFAGQPETEADIRLTLGKGYRLQGRYAEAQRHLERSVQLHSALLEAENLHTLTSKNNLAMLYGEQEKYEQAEPLYREVLIAYTHKRGADHPNTLNAKDRLAQLYLNQGKYDRAEPLFRELADSYKWRTGADSLDYARMLQQLGFSLMRQQKFTSAEPLLRDCLTIYAKKNLPESRYTFNTHNPQLLLGGMLLDQQKYADAEPLLLQGYQGLELRYAQAAQIPPRFKSCLTEALERLVQLYDAMGQKDKADAWRKRLEETKVEAKTQPKP